MIDPKIKFRFNQLEHVLIGFLSDFRRRLQEIVPNCPVYFQNSGDFSYYIDRKFVKTKNEELYKSTPRVVLKVDDIQPNVNEDTYSYNTLIYKFEDKNYSAIVRRKAYNLSIQVMFVCPSYISLLNYIEVMAIFSARDNCFTYGFMGNKHQSSYISQSNNIEIPQMDIGSASRNYVFTTTMELQAHCLVPKIETIQEYNDTITRGVMFELEQHLSFIDEDGEYKDLIEYEERFTVDEKTTNTISNVSNSEANNVIDGTELARKLKTIDLSE